MPQSALYLFPSDLVDEGVDAVRTRGDELGATTLTVATAYHQARDVVPHAGAKPRIRYRRDGVFFRPDPARWTASPALPRVQPDEEVAALEQLAESGARLEAWTVFLHNTSLAEGNPELASVTCFGDPLLSNICPLNPDAAEYAAALADDISARGLDIVAEALSAQTFGHGHHHERSFTPVSALDEAVLGICFCVHCRAAGSAAGVDVGAVAAAARDRVQAAYGGDAPGGPASREALADALGDDVVAYLQARERGVAALAERVAAVVHANGRSLSFMDLTGAVLGYDDGRPTGAPAAEQGWRLAIDPRSAAAPADSYSVLGYVDDPERLRQDVASSRAAIGETPLRVILRPGFPDTRTGAHLREKVLAARAGGADQVDFYNYGMYDQSVLDRIPAALA